MSRRTSSFTIKLLPPGLNIIPTKLVKINHSLNQINAKKTHPKFDVLKIKSMRKVIHVRSILNLLSELSLVNQHSGKLGKVELRRRIQSCRYKIFLVIHHTWKYYPKKLVGLEATFSPANIRKARSPGDEVEVSWGRGCLLCRN